MKKQIKKLIPSFLIKTYRKQQIQKRIKPFLGNKVYCILCGNQFTEFAPFGIVQRQNARCHACGSLERHRLLWKYTSEKTNLFTSKQRLKLLHFAPERALYENFVAQKNIEYVPCDINPTIYSYDKRATVTKVDITQIPFGDNHFDVIICNHVLEHIPDDKKAISELYRVMKKGGWGIFQVPIDYTREFTYEDFTITDPQERLKAFGQHDHVRWYGRDYKDRLKAGGFDVKEDDYIHSISPEEIFRLGLNKTELIYFCRK